MKPLYSVPPALSVTGEKAEAITHLLTTSDRVTIIQGKAGTGKTTIMTEAISLIEAVSNSVVVVAPTSQASRGVLRDEGFANAETVARLLTDPELQDRLQDGSLWMDEAGLSGTGEMLAVLELVTRKNARLILSGDTRQHSAVIRGDALRVLCTVAGIRSAEISRIFRQKNTEYRQAVEALSQGDIKTGFARLDGVQAIRQIDPDHPCDELADSYVSVLQKGKTALVICPTHAQGEEVTDAIRQKLRASGLIGQEEVAVTRLVNLSLTAAEKSDPRNYVSGHVLQFSQNGKGIKRGSRWSVVSSSDKDLVLKDDTDKIIPYSLERPGDFEVYQQNEITLSKGDAIRITRNGFDTREKRLNNGQFLEVAGFDKQGRVIARNKISQVKYTLDQHFGHIAYAHTVTSHASQGKTVDEIFIAQPAATFPATDARQFYVSVSRGRDQIHIYTDDKEGLLRHASEMRDRESALELIGKAPVQHALAQKLAQRRRERNFTPATAPAPITPPLNRSRTHAPKPIPQ